MKSQKGRQSVRTKQPLLRFMCILMLVFMHFGICGQSIVSLLHLPDTPVPARLLTAETTPDSQETLECDQSEWADLDGRRRVLRHPYPQRFLDYPQTLLLSLGELSRIHLHAFPLNCHSWRQPQTDVCLVCCSLII